MGKEFEGIRAEFDMSIERMVKVLGNTADDKLHWSPSPTARTPLQLVVHAAYGIAGIMGMIQGKPFEYPSIAAADAEWRRLEKLVTTREEALSLLREHADVYRAWLDTVPAEKLATIVQLPFGAYPMGVVMHFAAGHTMGHAAQLEYVQTIYGDLDWHVA